MRRKKGVHNCDRCTFWIILLVIIVALFAIYTLYSSKNPEKFVVVEGAATEFISITGTYLIIGEDYYYCKKQNNVINCQKVG